MCVCVCVFIYMSVSWRVQVHVYLNAHVWMWKHVCQNQRVSERTYAHVSVCMKESVHCLTSVCPLTRASSLSLFSSLFSFTHTHTHTHTHSLSRRTKLKRAVHDMRDFQFYYSATAALLQEPVIQKYSSHFVNHGISVDVLPLLTAGKLILCVLV
jgi:hypothetical protein